MAASPGSGSANPRKFSEKIALHTQRQAEETRAFEQLMTDLTLSRVRDGAGAGGAGGRTGWRTGPRGGGEVAWPRAAAAAGPGGGRGGERGRDGCGLGSGRPGDTEGGSRSRWRCGELGTAEPGEAGGGARRPKREDDPERKSHAAPRRAGFWRCGFSVLRTPAAGELLTVRLEGLGDPRVAHPPRGKARCTHE